MTIRLATFTCAEFYFSNFGRDLGIPFGVGVYLTYKLIYIHDKDVIYISVLSRPRDYLVFVIYNIWGGGRLSALLLIFLDHRSKH